LHNFEPEHGSRRSGLGGHGRVHPKSGQGTTDERGGHTYGKASVGGSGLGLSTWPTYPAQRTKAAAPQDVGTLVVGLEVIHLGPKDFAPEVAAHPAHGIKLSPEALTAHRQALGHLPADPTTHAVQEGDRVRRLGRQAHGWGEGGGGGGGVETGQTAGGG